MHASGLRSPRIRNDYIMSPIGWQQVLNDRSLYEATKKRPQIGRYGFWRSPEPDTRRHVSLVSLLLPSSCKKCLQNHLSDRNSLRNTKKVSLFTEHKLCLTRNSDRKKARAEIATGVKFRYSKDRYHQKRDLNLKSPSISAPLSQSSTTYTSGMQLDDIMA